MILPMQDEETGAEPRVLSASICDPYLLLIRDDSSAFVAHMNSDDELEEVEKAESTLTSTKWVSGCLYADTAGIFGDLQAEKKDTNIFMFLLSAAGALQVSIIYENLLWWQFSSKTLLRSMLCRICQNLYILPRVYATSHPY